MDGNPGRVMTQHRVIDEHSVSWIVDDEDAAGRLWRDIPNLPPDNLLVPRALLIPGVKTTTNPDQLLPKLTYKSVPLTEVMEQMAKEQIYLMLRDHYGV